MTLRVWGKSLLAALGVGALAGAGQLGLAYGLGIIVWRQDYQTGSANAWYAQLAWVCAIGVMAVLAGTAAGVFMRKRLSVDPAELARDGLSPDDLDEPTPAPVTGRVFGINAAFAATAALGALLLLPLAMLPAREARPLGVGHPADAVQVVAVWGLIIGVIAAVASHTFRSVGWSITATAGWLWVAGLIAAVRDISNHTTGTGERLAVPMTPAGAHSAGNAWVLLTMLAVGLILGTSVAVAASARRESAAVVISAGVAGPILIMVMYLVAGKGVHTTGQTATDHLVPYRSAPFAALLALFGAVFVAIMTQRRPGRTRTAADATTAVLPAVAAARHRSDGTAPSDDWRSNTQQRPIVQSHRASNPTSPAPVTSAPISAPPAPSFAPIASVPAAAATTPASASADEWPGGRSADEWPGGRAATTSAAPDDRGSSRKDRKAARRAAEAASDWPGGQSTTVPVPEPPQARAPEAPRIYAVPNDPAPAEEPARNKRGIFRRSSTSDRRPATASVSPEAPWPPPLDIAPKPAPAPPPAVVTPQPKPAAASVDPDAGKAKRGLFRRSDKAEPAATPSQPSVEPTVAQRFSTGKPVRSRPEPAAERSSGSLFTPVEPVHTRSRSGLFSHTDSFPTVPAATPAQSSPRPKATPPPAQRQAPTQAGASRSEAAARAGRPEPTAAPHTAPAAPATQPAGDGSFSRRKAKKAEKAAREQARMDYERQRGDTEFENWLGEIAPPPLPAGKRKQINDEDDEF